ncbi:MAG: GtrA family protein [Gammaproteobacteria bacterium]
MPPRIKPDYSLMRILFRYSLFAALATFLNLVSQEISLQLYQGLYALYVAIILGTAVGLISKYILDKLFIFNVQADSLSDDLTRFLAYSLTGVVTTLIFWGFELAFDFLFGTRLARYTGAILGLTIGYVLKYQLDKRYVFFNRVV